MNLHYSWFNHENGANQVNKETQHDKKNKGSVQSYCLRNELSAFVLPKVKSVIKEGYIEGKEEIDDKASKGGTCPVYEIPTDGNVYQNDGFKTKSSKEKSHV